jgi:hypothetical protein
MGENREKAIDRELSNTQKRYIEQLEKRMEELEVKMDHETDPVTYKQVCEEYKAVELELEAAKRPIKVEE